MKRVYYLSTCDKCKRILSEVEDIDTYELIDIKQQPISEAVLDQLYLFMGSYESLFNKRAIKFKDEKIKSEIKKDDDYRRLILAEYTFIKRPIFLNGEKIGVERAV